MWWKLAAGFVALVTALGAFNYFRPIPAVSPTASLPVQETVPGTMPTIPWPTTGSAVVGVSGLGLIASSENEKPLAAASVTKVMTALIVLTDKPLQKDEPGPSITITDADVQSYQADLAEKQSVVEVQVGEQLTEFELLEGLLIPSANNFAETLARWDAGSIDRFVVAMNKRASDLHLTHTTFADTSGASPESVSTPGDLMALGMEAMRLEVFAQIVAMPQADLPIAKTVYNVDGVLGQSGIIGIKTGSGLAEGANFLFAAAAQVDGHPLTLFGCVMGQPSLARAFAAAKSLIASMKSNLHVRRVIARNQAVASYVTPWGGQSDLVSTVDVDLAEWPGMILRQRLDASTLTVDKPLAAGTREGSEHLSIGDYSLDVELVTGSPLYPPGRLWRLTRINFL
ncbi:MAG: D-alanyl-D-alanine carboxypeptidase [Chloroflexi bacterium]|nr:MAG: D-alanyl-D-alanine carboxypeptidase [Chloroflexota bacterium]TMC69819.1 MAG: D-alanyl-D-alanine carboxypeptidase [Chloroflexota bacterium]